MIGPAPPLYQQRSTHTRWSGAAFGDAPSAQIKMGSRLSGNVDMTDRSQEREVEHYVVEKELAARLRNAPADQRAETYAAVYDELFRTFPDHPQLAIDPQERARFARARWRFVSRFTTTGSCLMEIGGGDCVFATIAAGSVRKVVVVEVSEVITSNAPSNIEVIISDGTSIPVDEGTVHVCFSDQLMEHLHPDDALQQLANVARAIRPGGIYVCITPNRVSGPHDVSRRFDDVASGLHIREYSAEELEPMFLEAGFSKVDFYAGGRGHYVRLPSGAAKVAEHMFERLPKGVRTRAKNSGFVVSALGLNVVARR